MKNYYRVMLGAKSAYINECLKGGFIGADFDILQDLTSQLPDNWREFNKKFIPIWLESHPDKTRIGAGLSCGALWTIAKGIQKEDIIISPDGMGKYYVGEVQDDYHYHPGEILPHRRSVQWHKETIDRTSMTDALRNSAGSIGTVSTITVHAQEIEFLIKDNIPPEFVSTNPDVEDPAVFALEKYLEEFLADNWKHTELGKKYDIFEDNGEKTGRQYPTDTGTIDILAVSKDKKELLVVELKRGRASDVVVGQIQRYMGYVKEELLEKGQSVKGVIIALEDDLRIRRALSVATNIDFYKYEVSFKLHKT